ncbi:MAG: glucodextranase DOMON-like domain-containing protein [Elusimicrobiota bacterium]
MKSQKHIFLGLFFVLNLVCARIHSEDQPRVVSTPHDWSIFLVLHPEGDADQIQKFLSTKPFLKINLIFPARYFTDPKRKETLQKFRVLQSSGQIEVALTLNNEPNLPLLSRLSQAGDRVLKWGFDYIWPDDIAAQIARGSGRFQKEWLQQPNGFYPPYLALSVDVIDSLKRFRINWIVSKPDNKWGILFFGGMGLVVSEPQPLLDPSISTDNWAKETAIWALERPFALVDSSLRDDPASDLAFLTQISKRANLDNAQFQTGIELTETAPEELIINDKDFKFENDFSLWIQTPQQKRAWYSLSEARSNIEKYKNSGTANLQRLDSALEELYQAQAGDFLLALGQTDVLIPNSERTFLATLSNVYRLCGLPIPPYLNRSFSEQYNPKINNTYVKPHMPSASDKPFFTSGNQKSTWNDLSQDDFGPGNFTYPTGGNNKGIFDIKEFSISWDEDQITFSIMTEGPFVSAKTILQPLFDVYIDVNRVSGAGNTTPLKNRGAVSIDKNAAWEYALNLIPGQAHLFQALSNASPRRLKLLSTITPNSNTLSVSVPRSILKGDPEKWRLSVIALGAVPAKGEMEITPASISPSASARNFGGATLGANPPPIIDILSQTIEEQKRIFPGASGFNGIVPYVESK